MNENWVLTAIVVCACAIVLIVVLALCGGCTPMEVGSEDHAASGGRGKTNNTQYSSVVTDVNTHVMSSGTTLPNDPYMPHDRNLPYDPHPQTAHRFTGYASNSQPQTPAQVVHSEQSYQSGMPGANRPFTGGESPPPSYNEATQPTAPAQGQVGGRSGSVNQGQSYGW